MNRSILVSVAFLFGLTLHSQDFITSDYDWPEDPSVYACPDSLLGESLVVLKKKHIQEYGYLGDDFVQRKLFHQCSYLGSDEAIEQGNRVYLPISAGESLDISKARAINPNGAVIELAESDINAAEDEEGNMTYYYAFKGLEKGSIIEYFHVQTIAPEYTGVRQILQSYNHQLNVDFEIISPWNLVFTYKGLNGFGEMESDSSDKDLNHLTKHFDFIPKYIDENQSFYGLNALQFIYKLDQNLSTGKKDLVSYGSMAEYIVTNNSVASKSERKIISKWLKESGAKGKDSKEMQLRAYEAYLKQNLAVMEIYADDLEDLDFVSKNKLTNARGMMKAIALGCTELDIKFEIVLTINRSKEYFDPIFESYNYLEDFLIYFPELEKYLDPMDNYGVLGITSPYLLDNNGVFFQTVKLGDFVSGISVIKYLEGNKADDSHHDMFMNVKLNDDFSSLNVELEAISTGQFAAGVQPYYDLLDPEQIESANKDQVKWISESVDIESIEIKNEGYQNLGIKPFLINAKFNVNDFVVKAREKYLLKIGLLIGPQTEMYQETKRRLPVNGDFRKVYNRVITFEIPDGYAISNLENINMNVKAEDEEGIYAQFASKYTLDGNTLKINCDEFYKRVNYTVDEYEDYRAVVNSAADFNKLVIYLEKE